MKTIHLRLLKISCSILVASVLQASTEDKAPNSPKPDHPTHQEGPHPKESLEKIRQGNQEFREQPGIAQDLLLPLSKGQRPHTVVISCSDSRVPPEIIFKQAPGQLFTVRTAGMSLDSNVIGSVEYAVEHLNSRNVVVLGHTSCGAVKATLELQNKNEKVSEHSPALQELLTDLQPRLEVFKGLPHTPQLLHESSINTRGVVKDLLERSTLLRGHNATGKILLTPAVYSLETGRVDFL